MNNSNIYTVEMSDFKAIDFFGNLNIENVGDSKTQETLIELVEELSDIEVKGDTSQQPNFTDLKLVFIAGRLMSKYDECVEPVADSELAWNVYSSYLYFYNDDKNTSITGLDDFKQAIETYIFFMFHPNGDDDSIIDKLESLLEGVDLSNENIPLFVKNALSKYGDKDSTEDIIEEVKEEDEEFSFIPLDKAAQQFVPPMQLKTIKSNMEFNDVRERLNRVVSEMPMPYDTDGVKKKMAMLHYFSSSSDWYIIEKDSSKEQYQAFGYTVLNGDYENAELGYISIEELKENEDAGVELDIYFEPTLLSEVTDGMYDDSEDEIDEVVEDEIDEVVEDEIDEVVEDEIKSDAVESDEVKLLRIGIDDMEDMRRLFKKGSSQYKSVSNDIKDVEDMISILK